MCGILKPMSVKCWGRLWEERKPHRRNDEALMGGTFISIRCLRLGLHAFGLIFSQVGVSLFPARSSHARHLIILAQ